MSINEMVLNAGIRSTAEANKALEAHYYLDQHEREKGTGIAALYHMASVFTTALSNSNIREEIIAIAVDALAQDFPKLLANSASAHAFREWSCNRLRVIIANKLKSYYRHEDAYWGKHVPGDRPINEGDNLTLFMLLSGPDDEYFAEEEEYENNMGKIMFYNRLADLVAKECPSYTLGFWNILIKTFAPNLNVPQMYMDGELESFPVLLHRNGVKEETIYRLMTALVKSQQKFISKEKTYAQAQTRCRDYTRLIRKVLSRHDELLHYITTK